MDGLIAYALSKKYADEVGRSILDTGFKTQVEQDRSILQTAGQEKILYFIPKTTAKPSDGYDEYVYSNNAWEQVGATDVDLSSYATKAEVGNLNNLPTTDKSSIVSAISETFTSVSNGKSLVASAITDKGVSTSSDATFSEMAQNIEAIPTFSEIDKNAPLIFIDWDGTIIQSYSREDALALEVLPNVENMTAYSSVDHKFLSFQTWNYSLAEIKTWLQTHSVGQLAVRAFYVTVDDKNHNYFRNQRYPKNSTSKKFYIQKRKISDIADSEFRSALLEKVSIPNGVTSIGYEAFAYARTLKHVNIPNSVTSISGSAFKDCPALQDVNIPEGITSIPGNMFYECYSITKMIIPDGVTIIGASAFWALGAPSISIPDSVTDILSQAFRYSALIDIVIKGTPKLDNVNAFNDIDRSYRIYVPRSNLTWFESATNWSSLYSHVVAIEDYIEYLESIGISVDEYK